MQFLMFALAVGVTLAIFLTTRSGGEIAKRIGLRNRVAGAASSEDVEFLRTACDGDRMQVDRRLQIERERYPELTEADHYRRAIRKVLAERASSES
jgi:hypothetical protein